LETAIRISKVETWGTTFDICSQIMAYAADVVIMGGDDKMLKYLHHWSNKQIRWG